MPTGGPWVRDPGVSPERETERKLHGGSNPDPWSADDGFERFGSVGDAESLAGNDVPAVVVPGEVERPAETSGAHGSGKLRRERFRRPQENRLTGDRRDVGAVDLVDPVYVERARGAKHRPVPARRPPERMVGRIPPDVRLRLYDPTGAPGPGQAPDQPAPEELPGHPARRPAVPTPGDGVVESPLPRVPRDRLPRYGVAHGSRPSGD